MPAGDTGTPAVHADQSPGALGVAGVNCCPCPSTHSTATTGLRSSRAAPASWNVVFPLSTACVISSGVLRLRTGGVRSTVTIIVSCARLGCATTPADTRTVISRASFTTPVMVRGSVVHVDHVFCCVVLLTGPVGVAFTNVPDWPRRTATSRMLSGEDLLVSLSGSGGVLIVSLMHAALPVIVTVAPRTTPPTPVGTGSISTLG